MYVLVGAAALFALASGKYWKYDKATASYSHEWCFDEADRTVLHYADVTDELVPDIPTFGVWLGGWSSAYTVSILGSILLSEKVGINTSMYPTWDVAKYWDYDTNYPQSMADWFISGDMDVAFAMAAQWRVQDLNDMISEGEIVQAANGITEISAFWIPDYFFERVPEAALYATWKDQSFLKEIADGLYPYTGVNYAESGNKTNLTVWASVSSYTGAILLQSLAKRHELPFYFNFTGGEVSYAFGLKQMYDAKVCQGFACWPSTLNAVYYI